MSDSEIVTSVIWGLVALGVLWIGWSVKTLKSMTGSMGKIFESLTKSFESTKLSAETHHLLVEDMKSAYDIHTRQSKEVADLRVEAARAEGEKTVAHLRKTSNAALDLVEKVLRTDELRLGWYGLALFSNPFLTDEQNALVMSSLETGMEPASFREVREEVDRWRERFRKIRQESVRPSLLAQELGKHMPSGEKE